MIVAAYGTILHAQSLVWPRLNDNDLEEQYRWNHFQNDFFLADER